MEDNVKPFILSLLKRKAALPPGIDIDSFRYLDAGQVDSLGLIKFIFEIEEKFGIEFSPEDTQSDEFRTIHGLVSLILHKQTLK